MPDVPTTTADPAARRLGWASVVIGLPEVVAPAAVARVIGVPGRVNRSKGAVAAAGVRELVAAGGLLSGKGTRGFLWSRVAGDAMDLALLRQAMRAGARGARTKVAAAGVVGITALDVLAAVRHQRTGTAAKPLELTATTTIYAAPQEVYAEWRALERLPRYLHHVEAVTWLDDRRTRWQVRGPLGRDVSWDAELVDDVPGERISWRSLPGADVVNEGSVELRPAPGDRGTEIRVRLRYLPRAGAAGQAFARLFGEQPRQQVEDDLRRFKQVVETGDVVRSDAAPEGTVAAGQLVQRPAQPVG